MDQTPNQETTKESFVTVPYIQGLSEEFRKLFKVTKVQIIFKGCYTLEMLLMHFVVSNTKKSGVIGINVEKIQQIWLPSNEHLALSKLQVGPS